MMRFAFLVALIAGVLGLTGPHSALAADAAKRGDLTIGKAWVRASVGAATGAFLEIRNDGEADRLVSVSSPAAPDVRIHVTVKDGDVMKMRDVDGIDVPAHGAVALQPGGYHIMVMGLPKPLKEGDTLPLTLHFAKAGTVDVVAEVVKPGAMGAGAMGTGAMGGGDAPDHAMGDHQHMH